MTIEQFGQSVLDGEGAFGIAYVGSFGGSLAVWVAGDSEFPDYSSDTPATPTNIDLLVSVLFRGGMSATGEKVHPRYSEE